MKVATAKALIDQYRDRRRFVMLVGHAGGCRCAVGAVEQQADDVRIGIAELQVKPYYRLRRSRCGEEFSLRRSAATAAPPLTAVEDDDQPRQDAAGDLWIDGCATPTKASTRRSGFAEQTSADPADIVVASAFDKRSTRELLKAKGLHLAELAVPRTLDEARQQIREAGDITGHPDRAAAEIARLDAALARARRAVSERHFRVLPLSRRGWVAGSDSFVGSLLG